jgi:hypothetical protein
VPTHLPSLPPSLLFSSGAAAVHVRVRLPAREHVPRRHPHRLVRGRGGGREEGREGRKAGGATHRMATSRESRRAAPDSLSSSLPPSLRLASTRPSPSLVPTPVCTLARNSFLTFTSHPPSLPPSPRPASTRSSPSLVPTPSSAPAKCW